MEQCTSNEAEAPRRLSRVAAKALVGRSAPLVSRSLHSPPRRVQNVVVRLLALLLVPLALFATIAGFGCNSAQLYQAPDGGPRCSLPVIEAPCKVQAAGTPGCTDDLGSTATFGRDVVLDGGTYPSGCGVIVYDVAPDEQNQCSQLGTCHCNADGGAYSWLCQN